MPLQRVSDLDLKQLITARGAPYFPSPPHWEDEVLYFMLVDRFSDGQEKGFLDVNGTPVNSGSTLMFTAADAGNAIGNDADANMARCWGKLCGWDPERARFKDGLPAPHGRNRYLA
jgi:hypothetical protein